MAGQRTRTTFAKLQRERARMEKQRLKRERRLEKGDAEVDPNAEQPSAYLPGEEPWRGPLAEEPMTSKPAAPESDEASA